MAGAAGAEGVEQAAERFRRVADAFGRRVDAVPAERWDDPAPCEGWVARDVVGHLVTWVPGLLGAGGLDLGELPSAADDPVGAWHAFDDALQAALDDPAVAGAQIEAGPMGTMAVADAVDRLVTSDVLLHTWDLARATGLDDRLDPALVHELLVGMEPLDEVLRSSGHYGPKVAVPDDADEQTRLMAFIGRDPAFGRA